MKSWFARFRVTARMARRQAARTKLSSLLVVLMVALPVAAMAAGAIIASSSIGTTEQRALIQLGHNEGYVRIIPAMNSTVTQSPTEPENWGHQRGDETVPPPLLDDPSAVLPTGTRMLPVSDRLSIQAETAGGIGTVTAMVGDVWDPAFAGRFDVVAGSAPTTANEIMVTQAALERTGARIGEDITLLEPALTATVTGVIDVAFMPDVREVLFFPWAQHDRFDVSVHDIAWYLPEHSLSWAEIQGDLNPRGMVALSRVVIHDPPETEWYQHTDYWRDMLPLLMILAAGAVFAAYQVMLLAGAAFAVSSRRQLQSLATATSVGASPAEVRRVVLLQGTVLGGVGGLIGTGLGAVIAWSFMRLASDGSRTQFWGYNVPWWLLVLIVVFAVTVGTLSALIPARAAAKVEVLAALRGARKPQPLSTKRPVWGSVLLLVGLGLTVLGAFVALAISRLDGDALSWDSPVRTAPWIALIAGPLVAQIGVILAGSWILRVLSGFFARLGLGARLASRDAAANASRSVPAFASIASAVFIRVFAVSMFGATFTQNERNYVPSAPIGTVHSSLSGMTYDDYHAAGARASEELQRAGARAVGVLEVPMAARALSDDELPYPMPVLPASRLCDHETQWDSCPLPYLYLPHSIMVVDPDDLEIVLGTDLPTAVLRDFTEGTALTAQPLLVEDEQIEIGIWNSARLWRDDGSNGPDTFTQDREHAQSWHTIPAIVGDYPVHRSAVILAPQTAERLGFATIPERVVAAFDELPNTATLDALNQAGTTYNPGQYFSASVERGPDHPWPWYLLVGGVLLVLVLGASAVSIGLARFDGRADDATLAAVGGTRGIRRSISFWQAIVIAGVGTWVGTLTGILPAWGFTQAIEGLRLQDFPWPIIAGIALGLPLLIALGAWLLSPRPAPLTHRTAIM